MSLPVKSEQLGWRDESISLRHRKWGFNCPAVDVDFLMIEYDLARPVALVEYKYHLAAVPNFGSPSLKAAAFLANASAIPFFVAHYWRDIWAFQVFPGNEAAFEHFTPGLVLTEREFVGCLYAMRQRLVDAAVIDGLNNTKPEGGL